MKEQLFSATNGIDVKFRHKSGKYDFQHIIFVFSGFLNSKPGNYDFINALNDCPCDVIWIDDNFEGMYAYYLCINMDFKVEAAVTEFINSQIKKQGISLKNVTVTGFSKGGTAALYYGLRLNIDNIVISVPQIFIGDYISQYWSHVAKHMMGISFSKAKVQYLNNLLLQLLIQDSKTSRNIYLLTSEADIQYLSHIEPNLPLFNKYDNFNLLKTHSLFVREHSQVTSHHTALLLSIYYALASEAIPRFNTGKVNFFGNQRLVIPEMSHQSSTAQPFIDLKRIDLVDNNLFIDGIAILRGIDAEEYADVDYKIIFKGDFEYNINLAKANRPNLTRALFENTLVIYDKCWVTTPQYKGVDISGFNKGNYELYLFIKIKNIEKVVKVLSSNVINIVNESFILEVNNETNRLVVK